jgi:hypothetical protein
MNTTTPTSGEKSQISILLIGVHTTDKTAAPPQAKLFAEARSIGFSTMLLDPNSHSQYSGSDIADLSFNNLFEPELWHSLQTIKEKYQYSRIVTSTKNATAKPASNVSQSVEVKKSESEVSTDINGNRHSIGGSAYGTHPHSHSHPQGYYKDKGPLKSDALRSKELILSSYVNSGTNQSTRRPTTLEPVSPLVPSGPHVDYHSDSPTILSDMKKKKKKKKRVHQSDATTSGEEENIGVRLPPLKGAQTDDDTSYNGEPKKKKKKKKHRSTRQRSLSAIPPETMSHLDQPMVPSRSHSVSPSLRSSLMYNSDSASPKRGLPPMLGSYYENNTAITVHNS